MSKVTDILFEKLIKKAWATLAKKSKKICAICEGDFKTYKSTIQQASDGTMLAMVYTDLVNEKMGKSKKIRLCGKCLSRLKL